VRLKITYGGRQFIHASRKHGRLNHEFSATFSWLRDDQNRVQMSMFTAGGKAFIEKQGDECTPVAENYCKAEIGPTTDLNWNKMYSRLPPTEMRRRKQLEYENGRLK
jgi:hypothetical protein